MRLDKYLKVSRIIKRRTVANEACDAGRVEVNGKVAKAGLDIKVGDIIEISFGTNKSKYCQHKRLLGKKMLKKCISHFNEAYK